MCEFCGSIWSKQKDGMNVSKISSSKHEVVTMMMTMYLRNGDTTLQAGATHSICYSIFWMRHLVFVNESNISIERTTYNVLVSVLHDKSWSLRIWKWICSLTDGTYASALVSFMNLANRFELWPWNWSEYRSQIECQTRWRSLQSVANAMYVFLQHAEMKSLSKFPREHCAHRFTNARYNFRKALLQNTHIHMNGIMNGMEANKKKK